MRTTPLFGTGIRAISDIVTRQRRVNCLYDIRKDQDRSAVVLLGTPGSVVWSTLPKSSVRGWHVIGVTMYVVAGDTLYSVTPAGVYTPLVSGIYGSSERVEIADNSIQLIIVTRSTGYVYTVASGTLTAITDTFFPVGASSVVFLNGRFIVNKPGTREFYVSALLDGLNWTYLGSLPITGTKENSSDLLVRVGNLNGALVLWGEQSVEFWQDVGSLPLPYQRINGATQGWGLAADLSTVEVSNTYIFLGYAPDGGISVIRLNGFIPEEISDSDLNTLFSSFSRVDDAVAFTYSAYGHPIYQITFPTENRSFAYDTKTAIWHEAQTGVTETARHFAKYGVTFNGRNYVTDETTGRIYELSTETYTDSDTPIKRQVVTRHVRNQGNEFTISELFLDFETGTGLNGFTTAETIYLKSENDEYLVSESDDYLISDGLTPVTQGSDPQIMLRISRNGGHVFGNERWVPLGKVGEFNARVILRRLGSARDFVVQITMTDPVKFVLASGSVDTEGGDD